MKKLPKKLQEKMSGVFDIFQKLEPEPKTELNFTNHFTLLVAIVLSAQATDVGVNKAAAALFKAVSTPAELLKLGEAGLKTYIKTIGLFNSKAKNIIKLCEILLAEHDGKIPRKRDELVKLPGVGVKTANVFLNCAFGEPIIGVDTHVFRVANRLGLISAKTANEAERKLNSEVPARYKKHAHHWLILHGRYVCQARKPKCEACVVRSFCDFYKNLV